MPLAARDNARPPPHAMARPASARGHRHAIVGECRRHQTRCHAHHAQSGHRGRSPRRLNSSRPSVTDARRSGGGLPADARHTASFPQQVGCRCRTLIFKRFRGKMMLMAMAKMASWSSRRCRATAQAAPSRRRESATQGSIVTRPPARICRQGSADASLPLAPRPAAGAAGRATS